jgi:hypothetical protein
MLFHCALPGVPMDFTHANFRAPWGFVRDTDPTWNVKVVAEESTLLDWQVRPETYADPAHFRRVKALGLEDRDAARGFMRSLAATLDATDYDLDAMAAMLAAKGTPLSAGAGDALRGNDGVAVDDVAGGLGGDGDDRLSPDDLRAYADAWMRDVHDAANLSNWDDAQDDDRTAFDLAVREFRHERPWLRRDIDPEAGAFAYRHPANGTVLYAALRAAPDGSEEVLFAANMEGVPVEVTPATAGEVLADDPDHERGAGGIGDGWTVALTAPGVERSYDGSRLTLDNAQAVVWTRTP